MRDYARNLAPIAREDLPRLMCENSKPCVSIYVPRQSAGRETPQDAIRMKNLLKEAESTLRQSGFHPAEIADLLAPAMGQLRNNGSLGGYPDRGIVIFLSPRHHHFYSLPFPVQEEVHIDGRFHLQPLMPILSEEALFYILALSQRHTRLYKATRYKIDEMPMRRTPQSLEEAAGREDLEDAIQHRNAEGSSRPAHDRSALFHGHGGAQEAVEKAAVLEFFRQVDQGVRHSIGTHHHPLLLAGGESLRGLYREVNRYDALMDESLNFNPTHLTPQELHEEAWQIMAPYFRRRQREAIERLQKLEKSHESLVSDQVEEVVPAAYYKRVETLFIPAGKQIWGHFDPVNEAIELCPPGKPESEDLVDFTIAHTVLNGGHVQLVEPTEFPREAPMAAIFRY